MKNDAEVSFGVRGRFLPLRWLPVNFDIGNLVSKIWSGFTVLIKTTLNISMIGQIDKTTDLVSIPITSNDLIPILQQQKIQHTKPIVLRIFIPVALAVFLSLGISNHSFAQGWYNNGGTWLYRKAITITNSTILIPSAQSYFPVMVNLSSDGDLSVRALSTGNDILFTSNDGITKIPYEREKYTSTSGALVAWVQVPTLNSGSNTVIYMYYGNSSAGDQQQSTSTWDNNYKLVFHIADAGPTANDATSTGNNGTAAGTYTFGSPGQIDGSVNFVNGNTSPLSYIAAAVQPFGSAAYYGSFTYELWIKINSYSSNNGCYFLDRTTGTNELVSLHNPSNSRFYFQMRNNDGNDLGDIQGGTITTGSWVHIVMIRDYPNNLYRLYTNGSANGTSPSTNGTALTPPIPKLGRHASFTGSGLVSNINIDEFRISNIVRSADWIKAEYNNQSSPSTFYGVGTQQSCTMPSAAGTITGASSICKGQNNISYSVPLINNATEYTWNYSGTGAIINGSTNSVTINFASNATSGNLTVMGTNSCGNGTISDSYSITVNPLPTTTATKTDISCFNAHNGQIEITGHGGSGTYTLYWISNGDPYQSSNKFTGLDPGEYQIRVKDSNGCESISIP